MAASLGAFDRAASGLAQTAMAMMAVVKFRPNSPETLCKTSPVECIFTCLSHRA